MPAKYKLIYFNVTGRAEMVRTMFAAAGVEYEDERIKMADWPKLKAGKEGDFGNLSPRGASRGEANAKASLRIRAASP